MANQNYVALYQREDRLWTVGFYDPDGGWHSISDHEHGQEAADEVARLNGSTVLPVEKLAELVAQHVALKLAEDAEDDTAEYVTGERAKRAATQELIEDAVLAWHEVTVSGVQFANYDQGVKLRAAMKALVEAL